jgi:hypothetical protein
VIPFTYVVIRYVHDASAGESLNVGVLLVEDDSTWVGCRVDTSAKRFINAFQGFDAALHQEVTHGLLARVKDIHRFLGHSSFGDAGRVIRGCWPDAGLTYRYSEVKAGVSENLEATLDTLYERFIVEQSPLSASCTLRDFAIWKTNEAEKALPRYDQTAGGWLPAITAAPPAPGMRRPRQRRIV